MNSTSLCLNFVFSGARGEKCDRPTHLGGHLI